MNERGDGGSQASTTARSRLPDMISGEDEQLICCPFAGIFKVNSRNYLLILCICHRSFHLHLM